jgi:hypothetical protein
MMTTSEKNSLVDPKKIGIWLLTLVLWLVTMVLGVLAIMALSDIARLVISMVVSQNADVGATATRGWITSVRNIAIIVGGILWIGVAVGGMEYHFRHKGQRKSYKVFAWTIGIEIGLLVLQQILLRVAFGI